MDTTPNYQLIVDSLHNIADELSKLISISPPPQSPQPSSQSPILNNDRVTYLKKHQAANSQQWQWLKSLADSPTALYDDNGRAAAIVYKVIGDKNYAIKSYNQLMATLGMAGVLNANNVREYFLEFILMYSWVQDALTDVQKSSFVTAISAWSDFALSNNQTNVNLGGFRTTDTDQTTGQFFGGAAMDGLKIGSGTFLNSQAHGAFPTPVGGLTPTTDNLSTARNAIKYYLTVLAKGGTWFESCQYNSNTVVLLIMGWMAARDIYGQDYFPEIAAWIPDACDAILTSFTPDLKSRIEWGDDERAGELDLWEQYPYIAALQAAALRVNATTQAAKLADFLNKFPPITNATSIRGRYYYFFNTDIIPQTYYDGKGPLYNYSQGVGLYSRFDNGNLFTAFAPSRIAIDHENNYIADITWYANGEWVLTHPSTYGGIANNAVGVNALLVSGLSAMWNKGPIECVTTNDYTYYVGSTNGLYYGPWKTSQPAAFCFELTRTIFFVPKINTVFLCDRFNSIEPSSVADMSLYYQPDVAAINAELAKGPGHRHQINWHTPVIPTMTPFSSGGIKIAWTTPKNQQMQICSVSTAQLQLSTEIIDEPQFKSKQVREHFGIDNQWDCVVSCIRLNPTANDPVSFISTDDKLASLTSDGVTVMFSSDQNSRLIDPSQITANASPKYLVGCSGGNAIVVK